MPTFKDVIFFIIPRVMNVIHMPTLLLSGVNCPETVLLKKHVLIMEMIADEHGPALKLKDSILNSADLCIAYDQVVEVKLIHCALT